MLLIVTGMLVNGPYSLITTAVSADLGMHQSIKGIIYINEIKVIPSKTINIFRVTCLVQLWDTYVGLYMVGA